MPKTPNTTFNADQNSSRPEGMRVLIVSHMHPAVSRGGAEIAAYQMYQELKKTPGITAYFLAADGGKLTPPLGTSVFQPFGDDEYVCSGGGYNHFNHSSPSSTFPSAIIRLLKEVRPDVVHFHHFANLGVEVFMHVRRALPQARIILTLHEFLAICNHFGQMVKRPNLSLCHKSTPRDCAKCFPEFSENDFFMRELYLRRFFSLIDEFISPSHFLAERYIQWGLSSKRMNVVENGSSSSCVRRPPPSLEGGLILGFFGQISALKGVNLLLETAALLAKRDGVERLLRIEIHGDSSNQPPALREGIEALLKQAGELAVMRGSYDNNRVHELMQECHAILVPSIWWENSPLVIQEALSSCRPIICSDIGGMAEKVRDGLDGFHFRAASAMALANLLENIGKNPEKLNFLQSTLATPPSLSETVEKTINIYKGIGSNYAQDR